MRTPHSGAPARASVILLAVGALLLDGTPAQASGWTTVASPSEVPGDNYLYGAGSSGAGDVWSVGVVYPPTGGSFHGLIERYDGTAWRSMPATGLPADDILQDVAVVSAGDVWVVGENRAGLGRYDTLAAHWNGTAWTREPTPDGNPAGMNNVYGVAAAGSTVWAVGNYVDPASSINRRKLIMQRTVGHWRLSAAPVTATYESLAAVDATGPSDAWAVGSATTDIRSAPTTPLALHWNGTAWASVKLPAPAGTALTGVDARTPGDVWAVGSTSGTQPYVAHYDGTTWRQVATPALAGGGGLTDVAALSSSAVVAVGRSGGAALILRWNGTSWLREATPAFSNPFLTAAVAAGPGSVWAIGYRFELNAYANRTLTLLGG